MRSIKQVAEVILSAEGVLPGAEDPVSGILKACLEPVVQTMAEAGVAPELAVAFMLLPMRASDGVEAFKGDVKIASRVVALCEADVNPEQKARISKVLQALERILAEAADAVARDIPVGDTYSKMVDKLADDRAAQVKADLNSN